MSSSDPLQPPDSTVIRPRPGAGRRGETPRSPQPSTASPLSHERSVPGLPDGVGTGLNPLVQAATPLLLLAGQVRAARSVPDPNALRRQAVQEIRDFEERARADGIQAEVVRAGRYALCASLDEAVLCTEWGAQSGWAQETLLVELYRDASGGEKFFEMLERISKDPARHIDLLELQYLCIALGFAGKYHASDKGLARLRDLQEQIFRAIRSERGGPNPELSVRWRGIEDHRNRLIQYVPWWVLGAIALAVLAVTFAVLSTRLRGDAAPVQAALAGIGGAESIPVVSVTRSDAGPTLSVLLADDVARRTISLVEDGNQTRITSQVADLFASGSAVVNPNYETLLRRMGAAIERVPGRVIVTGHTDDQPVRSSRYADNFELSRDRAVNVARALQQSLRDPGRVTWNGLGSTRPLVEPVSLPANRALNRRVEIVHFR